LALAAEVDRFGAVAVVASVGHRAGFAVDADDNRVIGHGHDRAWVVLVGDGGLDPGALGVGKDGIIDVLAGQEGDEVAHALGRDQLGDVLGRWLIGFVNLV
jgi:hypothetical protein